MAKQNSKVLRQVLFLLLTFIGSALLLMAQETAQLPGQSPSEHGPSPEVKQYQHCQRVEIYRLRLVNDANGEITGSRDGGTTWQQLGHVLYYSEKVTNQGYTASKWAPLSAVSATAVNAIHIRTGYNAKDDKGVVFSILHKR
jgi:hypothetical protein